MLLVIAGSREAREHHVREAIYRCPWKDKITKVISGTAHGADKYGEKYAKENGIEIIRFPADWDQYGMSAGPRRNKEWPKMLMLCLQSGMEVVEAQSLCFFMPENMG